MTGEAFRGWLERYFEAWVSNDPESVEALFTPDAVYRTFAKPRIGVEGDLGLAHWRVRSRRTGANERDEYDGILAITCAPDGRCVEHREWFSHRTTD